MRWIAGVLALVVVVAAGFLLWKMQEHQVVLDPAEVQRVASRLLPGAVPPPGLKAVLALRPEAGLQVAVFAPSLDKADPGKLEGRDLRIVIAQPDRPSGTPDPGEVLRKIGEAQGRKAEEMDTLAQSPVVLSVGGRPHPGMESRVALKASGKRLQEDLTILPPGVIVLITGPDGSFDRETRDRFLAGLDAPEGGAAPAPPSPAAAPPSGPPGRPAGLPGRPPGPPGRPPGPPGPP